MSKMLFVQSEDYWGYDASSFDDAINFYKFTWVVSNAQYKSMSEDDQKRLYPCALFYVAGVTDNHNFLTLRITNDMSSGEAKVSGMEGTKRRTRRYEIGSTAQYSVGSYALQAAPASATNIEEIKEAVESGSTSTGSFVVSAFLDDATSVAEAVNYEDKSAESVGFAAPATEPSGSAYEPADPTVANPSTEGPSESELITMSAEIEYAELGDESYPIVPNTTGQDSSFNGHGVPQWYGAEGEKTTKEVRLRIDEEGTTPTWAVEKKISVLYDDEGVLAGVVSDMAENAENYANDHNDNYRFSAEGSGLIDHDRIDTEEDMPVILRYDNPHTQYGWSIEGDVTEEQEDYIEGEISSNVGSEPYPGEEDFEVDIDDGRSAYVETETDYGDYRFYGLGAEESFDAEGGRLRDIRGKFMNRGKAKNAVFGEVMSQQMGGYYRTGIVGDNPPVGQDISRRNPVAKAKYFVQPGVQNDNTGAWSKGPNFQQARKIAKGVAWDTVQDMGLAAESFNGETFCADCGTTKKYRGEQEEGCGCGSMSAEMEYAELGEELYPVVPNSEGGNTALDSGYGVPQWYGSAETFNSQDEAPEEDYEFSGPFRLAYGGPQMLRAIAPQAGLYFDFRVDEWEDASWAKLPDMTEEEYDACYFDFKKGGVFDSSDNLIVSMDDFAEAIFNYEIVNIHGNYNWSEGVSLKNVASRRKITDTLEEASPAKGVLVAPVIAAVAGILGGIFYARRS